MKATNTKTADTRWRNASACLFFAVLLFSTSLNVFAQCTNCTSAAAGNDVVLIFTSGSGSFTPPEGITSVQYLVVGGGGGGGGVTNISFFEAIFGGWIGGAGGGGAGGVRSGTLVLSPLNVYPVTVGAGGVAGIGETRAGGTGGASSFSTITSLGGGGGASVDSSAGTGGSGGGGRSNNNGGTGTSGQGNTGGNGAGVTNSNAAAGGGGGAGTAGGNGAANTGGTGGAGINNSILGSAVVYGGGGRGGGFFGDSPAGAGGAGGNGGGGSAPGLRGAGGNGTASTGGGGGGASGGQGFGSAFNGGVGGSGIVIIRYTPGGTRYSVNNGNWNAPATWSAASCSGTSGASIPTAADDVVICNNRTVTITAAAAAKSVILETGNQNVNLNHNAGVSLTVGSGGVTLSGAAGGTNTKSWAIGAGNAIVNGPVVINGGNDDARVARIGLTTGTLDINGNLTINSNAVARGVIDATGAANIFLSGSFSMPNGSARILPGTASTFTYDGIGNQTALLGVSQINYNNLVFAGSGIKNQTTYATPTITGTTTINAGVTFDNSASVIYQGEYINNGTTNASAAHQYQSTVTNNNIYSASAAHIYQANFVNNAVATASAINEYRGDFVNSGNYSASAAQEYRGNFTNSGTFTSGTGSHTFNGTVAQELSGATTFGTMTLNNSAGLTINNHVTVQSQLVLTSGALTTGSNILRVAQTGGWSGVNRGSGWVAGNLGLWIPTGYQGRTFDIGDATAYRPLVITIPNVTTAGFIVASISQANGDHPQISSSNLDAARSVNRWWTITSEGVVMVAMDVVFNYLASDVDVGAAPQNFEIQRYTGSVWGDVTVGSRSVTSSQGTTITSFGQFAIAERGRSTDVCTNLVGGIIGQYFNNTSLSGAPVATRLDGPINFDWVGNAPGVTGINADQFSVRWEGLLRTTQAGNYRFQTASDDGVRLWINDVLVINNWTDHSNATDTSGLVALAPNEVYSFRLEFYENAGSALMRLRWLLPGSATYQPIPAGPTPALGAGLYHCSLTEICPGLQPSGGISGEYFNNVALTGNPVGTRVDGPIDFNWGEATPGVTGVSANEFSTRWNGRLRATVTGNYQFQTRSDDGVRLRVNDQLIIDQWNDHSATEHTSANVYLVAGQVYPISLEYYERMVFAEIRLRWRIPGAGSFVAIPRGTTPTLGPGLYHCPAAPIVAGYLITHDGPGITCEAATVTVVAVDSQGAMVAPPLNTTVVLDAVVTGAGVATNSWTGGNSFTFDGNVTGFSKYLRQLTPASLAINVGDGNVTSSAATPLVFRDAGLRFYDLPVLPDSMVAGQPYSGATLRAVQTDTDTGACAARVSGSKTVRMAYECRNPATCSAAQNFTVNGNALLPTNFNNAPNYSNVTLNFDANGSANIPLNFTDVGLMRLHAQLVLPEQAEDPAITLTGISNEFVVEPYTFVVTTVTGNPATTSAGRGFVAAGENFSVLIEARNFSGARTPNFGNEGTSQRNNVELKIGSLVYPEGGVEGSLSGAGGVNFAAATPAGTMINNSVSWNEVGSITLRPELSDYLGAGDLPYLTTSGTVGRFYPARFSLTSATVENTCNGFSYMNQPELHLAYQLEAKNINDQITQNYHTPIYSTPANVFYVAENADNSVDLGARADIPAGVWTNGVWEINTTTAAFMRQASTAPDGPFSSLQLGVHVTDELDNRQLENMDMNATSTGICVAAGCNAVALGGPLNLRFGRLRIDDAFGPETVNLPVKFNTEYWNGSYFTTSVEDTWSIINSSCTHIPRTAITYPAGSLANDGNRQVSLNGGSTQGNYSNLQPTDVAFTGGSAGQFFTAPGTGTGNFVVNIDLANREWLRFDWNQDGNFNNDTRLPPANFGFGQYRGHDRIIYWREDFQ